MKKMISLLLLVLLQGCARSPEENKQAKPIVEHSEQKGFTFARAQAILHSLDVEVANLAEANKFAQENLLRSGERWDSQSGTALRTKMEEVRPVLFEQLRSLGMIDALYPDKKEYDYALIMGALASTVALRLDFLQELLDKGYSFKHIVLLGGERPLQDREKEGLPVSVTTEAEMMLHLFQHRYPSLEPILVNSRMVVKEDGTVRRPNTDDTLYDFIALAPHTGSCLVISNNPFIIRQTRVAERILVPAHFEVDPAGSGKLRDDNILMLMDEFARLVYEESKR